MPPLTYTYKETELSEDLNDGMEWMLRDYGRSFKKQSTPYHIGRTWWNLMYGLTQRSWRIIQNYRGSQVTYRTS